MVTLTVRHHYLYHHDGDDGDVGAVVDKAVADAVDEGGVHGDDGDHGCALAHLDGFLELLGNIENTFLLFPPK